MPDITIHIPMEDAEKSIEIEVTINGKKRKQNYRVEIFTMDNDCEPEEHRIACLRRKINEYSEGWQLMHIGTPDADNIPIMFRKKKSSAEAYDLTPSKS